MNEKNQLLSAIKKYDFALKELNLYLDTHPNCRRALSLFNQYKAKRENAMNEYISKYGAITVLQNNERWSWTDDPFPWEGR
ncbi:MAG: spore coat protein CotJB [Ruminococcus sp.]|nr:spore coat protein CotJB [Ruminococcus sp.]MBR6386316.1 spore coat protein CotJB [Ruminococcus sp.]